MPKRYSYRRYYGSRDKYSVEQTAGNLLLGNSDYDGAITVVPPADVQGMRKVKHITISLSNTTQSGSTDCYWALVYVPAGTSPSALNISTSGGNMYEPNQYVMSCGLFEFSGGPLRISSPLARNLNSGDQVALLIHSTSVGAHIGYVCRYAITLQ